MAHVQKRGNKWQARYRDKAGHEHARRFDRKIDAEGWLATNSADLVRGAWVDPRLGKTTVSDFARPWLARRRDLAVRTAELYQYLLERHIEPDLGAVPLAALAPSLVSAWHAQLASKHRTTAAKAYRLLSQILRSAVADKIVVSNPCQVRGAATEKAPERPVASVAEVSALCAAMPEHLRVVVLLASWCQLRRGEILGLRRRDVDLLHGTLSIVSTRTRTMGGDIVTKAPKTNAGRRTIAIPPNVVPVLTDHLERYVSPGPDSLVAVGEKGGPLLTTVLASAWSKARAAVGRPELRIHDMRHTGLTWSAATGASTAEIMRRAGHESAAAALKYQHATADRDRALADALANLATSAPVVPLADRLRTASGRKSRQEEKKAL
jgi:integrase